MGHVKSLIVTLIATVTLVGAPALTLTPGVGGGTAQPQSFCNIAPWMPFFCPGKR